MKVLFRIKSLLITFLRLFYSFLGGGEACVVCGEKSILIPLCPACRKSHFNVEDILSVPRCKFCGKELVSENEVCMECRNESVIKSADKVIPLFSYRLWNKELLFLWKINGIRSLSYFFAALVNKALKTLEIQYIVPVPPRPGKIKKNGWDQIDELCKILKYHYGFIFLPVLQRLSVEQQKKLNREERLAKIENAYIYSNKLSGKLPEKVCIIDDVCTTGSTLETCAGLIRRNTNISQIYALTLFAVD